MNAITADRDLLNTEKARNKITIDSLRQSLQNESASVATSSTKLQDWATELESTKDQEQHYAMALVNTYKMLE